MNGIATALPSPVESLLVTDAPESYIISLCQASAATFLIWDMIITYDQEIELIWRSPHCVVNYLFFIIRYLALSLSIVTVLVSQSSFQRDDVCRIYTYFFSLGSVLLISTMDALLVYRIFAFYERNRKVLAGLIILWVLNTAAFLVFAMLYSKELPVIHTTTFLVQGITGECVIVGLPVFEHEIWISELIFHSVLFTLVILRFIRLTATSWKTMGISFLCYIFIRDGFWAFIHLLVVFIISILRPNPATNTAVTQSAIVLIGVTGSRLTLNLRNLRNSSNTDPSNYTYWIGKKILFDTISETLVDEEWSAEFELMPLHRPSFGEDEIKEQ